MLRYVKPFHVCCILCFYMLSIVWQRYKPFFYPNRFSETINCSFRNCSLVTDGHLYMSFLESYFFFFLSGYQIINTRAQTDISQNTSTLKVRSLWHFRRQMHVFRIWMSKTFRTLSCVPTDCNIDMQFVFGDNLASAPSFVARILR